MNASSNFDKNNLKSNEKMRFFFADLLKRELTTLDSCANLDNFYNLKPQEEVIYFGIDCTGRSLHIGHLFQVIQGVRFINNGFKLIIVLGEATTTIGDPSDKKNEREKLSQESIASNLREIKIQLETVLKKKNVSTFSFAPLENFYKGDDILHDIYRVLNILESASLEEKWRTYSAYIWPFKEDLHYQILNNAEWINKLSCLDFLELGRSISLNYLLNKKWVKTRLKTTGLSYLGFSYSLLQAYDFYYLYKNYGCYGQMGGSDQQGNTTVGLTLVRSLIPDSKAFSLSFPLIVDSKGDKISKSETKKTLWLNTEKKEFYNFFRNMPDEEAYSYITKLTFLTNEQIEQLLKLNNPPKLRVLQRILLELMWFFCFNDMNELKTVI